MFHHEYQVASITNCKYKDFHVLKVQFNLNFIILLQNTLIMINNRILTNNIFLCLKLQP